MPGKGWSWRTGAKKRHYYAEGGRSLCGSWSTNPTMYFTEKHDDIPENCKVCKEELRKIKAFG